MWRALSRARAAWMLMAWACVAAAAAEEPTAPEVEPFLGERPNDPAALSGPDAAGLWLPPMPEPRAGPQPAGVAPVVGAAALPQTGPAAAPPTQDGSPPSQPGAFTAREPEPTLSEVQEAAARTAAGDPADDQDRLARAGRARWAPSLRVLGGLREDVKARRGEMRASPVSLDDTGQGLSVGLSAAWDLAALIYTRDEAQLAALHTHLAQRRLAASVAAAKVYLARAALPPPGAGSVASKSGGCLARLGLTAELDALTGGLWHAVLEREQADCAGVPKGGGAAR